MYRKLQLSPLTKLESEDAAVTTDNVYCNQDYIRARSRCQLNSRVAVNSSADRIHIAQDAPMPTQKPSRRRGIILTPLGLKKLRSAIQQLEEQDNYGDKYTLIALSEKIGLDSATIAKVLEAEAGVDKRTLLRCFRAFGLELDKTDYALPMPKVSQCFEAQSESQRLPLANSCQDLKEAVDVSLFYGRTAELAKLQQWLLRDRCRVVALLGMGGIGKTALAAKLIEQTQSEFEYVKWMSLRNAPPVHEILAELIQFLSQQQETQLPASLNESITRVLKYLQKHRCLLVLDNAETILQSGNCTGDYRSGYEGYGELLRRLGETSHQSTLVLTSTEKPKELTILAGEYLPVRCLELLGLKPTEAQKLFGLKGLFWGTQSEWQVLIEHYGGNPLMLKMVAGVVQELFEGQIAQVLEHISQDSLVFKDIGYLLSGQFSRLSALEAELMYWLAIEQQPVKIFSLQANIVFPVSPAKVLEALSSLRQRSLVNISASHLTILPVVMEYLTNRLVEQVCGEIVTQEIGLLRSHALLKATAKDYVHETQVSRILRPIIDGLLRVFRTKSNIENQLNQILARLREASPLEPGYTSPNLLYLLEHLKTERHMSMAQVMPLPQHQSTLAFSPISSPLLISEKLSWTTGLKS